MTSIDDDLLRIIAEGINRSYGVNLVTSPAYTRAWLASDVMQRLRAAWTAESDRVGDKLLGALRETERERDEARAEVEQFRYAQDYEMNQKEAAYRENDALTAEVERLRAAVQDLPDAVTVKREGEYVVVDLGHNCGALSTREGAADMAAIGLAAVQEFDREAEELAASPVTHLILDRRRQVDGMHAATCSCGGIVFARTPEERDKLVLGHLSGRAAADTTTTATTDDEVELPTITIHDPRDSACTKRVSGEVTRTSAYCSICRSKTDAHRARTHGEA